MKKITKLEDTATVGAESREREAITATSSPVWEMLETYTRGEIQQFVQRLLEEEVDDLLARKRSERRTEESAAGYCCEPQFVGHSGLTN